MLFERTTEGNGVHRIQHNNIGDEDKMKRYVRQYDLFISNRR